MINEHIRRITRSDRDARVLMAAGSAVLAKGGGIALQILAVPLIVRTLGIERYAVFSLVSSVLVFISFAQFGVGGYLTQQIAIRIPNNDLDGVRALTWTALLMVSGVAVVLGLVLFLVAGIFGLEWLWGQVYILHPEVLSWGFNYLVVIGVVSIIVNTLVGCQAGYQELHISNLYAGAGNFMAACGVFLVTFFLAADEQCFWVALYAIPLLVGAVNAAHLLQRHAELRYSAGVFRSKLVPILLKSGGGFMIVQSLLPLLQREGAKMAIAHQGNLVEVAHFSVFLQISTIVGGLIAIFMIPLYGAIADASGRGEKLWVNRRLKQVHVLFCLSIGFIGIISYFFGNKLIRIWLGDAISISQSDCLLYLFYFSTATMVYINQLFLLAQGRLRQSVIASIGEIILLLGLLIFFCPTESGALFGLMAFVQLVSSLPITVIALFDAKRSYN